MGKVHIGRADSVQKKAQNVPQIVYIDREVEKLVAPEKEIQVVEKPVEVIKYVDRIIELPPQIQVVEVEKQVIVVDHALVRKTEDLEHKLIQQDVEFKREKMLLVDEIETNTKTLVELRDTLNQMSLARENTKNLLIRQELQLNKLRLCLKISIGLGIILTICAGLWH